MSLNNIFKDKKMSTNSINVKELVAKCYQNIYFSIMP